MWALFVVGLPILASLTFAGLNDPIRTLLSLRRVEPPDGYYDKNDDPTDAKHHAHPLPNIYVMDYYTGYNSQELRRNGMRDPLAIEDSFIELFFPPPLPWIAKRIKRIFVPTGINTGQYYSDDNDGDDDDNYDYEPQHHCSTVSLHSHKASSAATTTTSSSPSPVVYFGRNFDWPHDAALVLRIHDRQTGLLSSLSVIDLHYLNLNQPNVHEIAWWRRLPLLFAPYYVMDGMNRHGVAISEMTVQHAAAPVQRDKPKIIYPALARLVLDYAETTADVISLFQDYHIYLPYTKIHFMVADASGDSRIIEFIHGHIRVTHPPALVEEDNDEDSDSETDDPESSSSSSCSSDCPPSTTTSTAQQQQPNKRRWQVCTNSIVWNRSEDEMDGTCDRYRIGSGHADYLMHGRRQGRAATAAGAAGSSSSSSSSSSIEEEHAIHVTKSMAVEGWTMWTSIYELQEGTFGLFYKTQPRMAYRDAIPRSQWKKIFLQQQQQQQKETKKEEEV